MDTATSYRTLETAHSSHGAPSPECQRAPETRPVSGQRRNDLLDADMLDALSANLREPLTIIKGSAETLLHRGERLSREERHDFLCAIMQASEHFENILRRFLPSEP